MPLVGALMQPARSESWHCAGTPASPPVQAKQLPPEQMLPGPQALPHAPQLFWSPERKVHVPLQVTAPVGQTQLPATQTLPWLHAEPQLPQFLASVWVATQVSPQRTVWFEHLRSLELRQAGSSR